MKTCAFLIFLISFFAISKVPAQTPLTVTRLADVRTVYVDQKSFRFTFSSCGTKAGGMLLPCPKHAAEREEFLMALKEWIGKSGFTVVDDVKDADGVMQGSLSIDDRAEVLTDYARDGNDKKKSTHDRKYQIEWVVNAWMINQDGKRIWTRGAGYPGISYGWSSKAKIEGKTLAKAIHHDFKKGK